MNTYFEKTSRKSITLRLEFDIVQALYEFVAYQKKNYNYSFSIQHWINEAINEMIKNGKNLKYEYFPVNGPKKALLIRLSPELDTRLENFLREQDNQGIKKKGSKTVWLKQAVFQKLRISSLSPKTEAP